MRFAGFINWIPACASMTATLVAVTLPVLHHTKPIQRLKPFFTPLARRFHPSEWQFNATTRAVVVDKKLPAFHRSHHAHCATIVLCPDASDEAVFRGIGQAHCVGFILERHGSEDGAEDFVLAQFCVGGYFGDQCWLCVETGCGGFGRDASLRDRS